MNVSLPTRNRTDRATPVGSSAVLGRATNGSKSEQFFARLLERRQQPGNCARCGRANPSPAHKTCPICLAAVRRRKLEALKKAAPITRGDVETMLCRIHSLETAVANLQISHDRIYHRAYTAGQRSIRKAVREVEKLEANRYADAYPEIKLQELATINHAYDRR